ncbi:MAG: OmpA family protein [Bacteroidetes bacterium]|nr:OmpA family protein [Bacteroidota bacterium]
MRTLVAIGFLLLLPSCVNKKKFTALETASKAQAERDKGQISSLQARLQDMDLLLEEMLRAIAALKNDTADKAMNLAKSELAAAELNRKLSECEAEQRIRLQDFNQEISRKNQTLQQKEIALNQALADAEIQKNNAIDVQKRAAAYAQELQKTTARVRLLEQELKRKDSAALALQRSIRDALTGFSNNGLNVETRNGKVYVSMSEQLLFKTGSTSVDPKGKNALMALAAALKNQPEIMINVEGHTDDQPIRGGTVKDNWDLSVLRATSIVRLLTEEGQLEPSRVQASGRSQYLPVDAATTPEARAKNRRTEIILTPRLDKILNLIQP